MKRATAQSMRASFKKLLLFYLVGILLCVGCADKKTTPSKSHDKQAISHHAKDTLRVITPDWGIAAELVGMGYPPIATGDIRAYEAWSGIAFPKEIQDIGIRYQPNPELMAQIDADLVVDNFFYEHIRTMYGDVPVKSINFRYDKEVYTWQDFAKPTQQLGQVIKQPKAAETYIKNSKHQLTAIGKQFRQKYPSVHKVAVVQFIDANNLRMFSKSSMYQPALKIMGLNLATFGKPNEWGIVPIKMTDLTKLEQDTCLIIIKPYSDMLQNELKSHLLWQKYGFGHHLFRQHSSEKSSSKINGSIQHASIKSRCMGVLEPVWLYGGIASMMSFANHLAKTPLTGVQIQQGQRHG